MATSTERFLVTGAAGCIGAWAVRLLLDEGVPVVAPAVGGPLDLVQDGVTGYLVTPGDAAAVNICLAPAALAAAPRRSMSRLAASKSETATGALQPGVLRYFRPGSPVTRAATRGNSFRSANGKLLEEPPKPMSRCST